MPGIPQGSHNYHAYYQHRLILLQETLARFEGHYY